MVALRTCVSIRQLSKRVMIMIVKFGRVLSAVVVMLILFVEVRPADCKVISVTHTLASAGRSVTNTTKKVAYGTVSTVKKVVAAPGNLLTKVGHTLTGK
jgi:hypothetical protein